MQVLTCVCVCVLCDARFVIVAAADVCVLDSLVQVSLGATMPVSVSPNCAIALRCIDARPGGIVRIHDGSELLVKPRQTQRVEAATTHTSTAGGAAGHHRDKRTVTRLRLRAIRRGAISSRCDTVVVRTKAIEVSSSATQRATEAAVIVPSCCVWLHPRDATMIGAEHGARLVVFDGGPGHGTRAHGNAANMAVVRKKRRTTAFAVVVDDGSIHEEHIGLPDAIMMHMGLDRFDFVHIEVLDAATTATPVAPTKTHMEASAATLSLHALKPITLETKNPTADVGLPGTPATWDISAAELVEAFFSSHAQVLGHERALALPVSVADGVLLHIKIKKCDDGQQNTLADSVVDADSPEAEKLSDSFYMLRVGTIGFGSGDANGGRRDAAAAMATAAATWTASAGASAAEDTPLPDLEYVCCRNVSVPSTTTARTATIMLLQRRARGGAGAGGDVRVRYGAVLSWTSTHMCPSRHVAPVSLLGWLRIPARIALSRLRPRIAPIWASSKLDVLPLPGCPMICGPAGAGKTAVARAMLRTLEEGSCVRIERVQCISLARMLSVNPGGVRQEVERRMRHASASPPCVLLLDDLHVLCPSTKRRGVADGDDGGDPSTELLHGSMTTWLCDAVDSFLALGAGHALIATSTSPSDVDVALTAAGRFETHITLKPPLSSEEREKVVYRYLSPAVEYDAVHVLAGDSAGIGVVSATDLKLLCERALHSAHLRCIAEEESASSRASSRDSPRLRVTRADAEAALRSFPRHDRLTAASRDAEHKDGKGDDDDPLASIGGLLDVKHALHDAFALPVLHERIFGSCPLRPRRSVLLHGPPGCGKTLVASCIAKLLSASVARREGRDGAPTATGGGEGVQTITVKGPELLNKYIGESEASVRALFARAREMLRSGTARHVVILLDEMDSIAPRRGADSTGVTDRVVNALLTEIDGVEDNTDLTPDEDEDDDAEVDGDVNDIRFFGDPSAVASESSMSSRRECGMGDVVVARGSRSRGERPRKRLGGLYVVGTSSRPDLIDPALLRPGRIDMHLLCPLPSFEDRLAILRLLTRQFLVGDSSDAITEYTLREAAARAEHMSSAELRAVVRDARLTAARSGLASPPPPRSGKTSFATHLFSEIDAKRRDVRSGRTAPSPTSSAARVTLN